MPIAESERVATEVGKPSVPQTLAPAATPARNESSAAKAPPSEPDDAPESVAWSKHWREDKVGCLLAMQSEVRDVDPCPEIPSVFVDPLQSLKLAQQIGQCAVPQGTPFRVAQLEEDETTAADEREKPPKRPGRPDVEQKRVVASRQDVRRFGPLLAAMACAMGLFAAARRAFVADGLSENWSVYKRYFARWTAVLDFVHALTYVYAAAMAGRPFAKGWPVYERWIRWVWAGRVSQVREELTRRQQEVGRATREDKEGSPRRVVQTAPRRCCNCAPTTSATTSRWRTSGSAARTRLRASAVTAAAARPDPNHVARPGNRIMKTRAGRLNSFSLAVGAPARQAVG